MAIADRRRRPSLAGRRCAVVLALACAAAAAGCAKKAPPPAPIVIAAPVEPKLVSTKVAIAATADINPDATGRPSPVVLRVYQLRDGDKFRNADFFALYDDDQKVLGSELLSRQEFMLSPSASQTVDVNVAADAKFLGAIAAFHDIRTAQWRVIMPAPHNGFSVAVERARIVVTATESD